MITPVSSSAATDEYNSEELTLLMGGEKEDVVLKGDPAVILLSGLQGSGKTTFAGKLATFIKKQNRTACSWPATCTAPPPSTRRAHGRLAGPAHDQNRLR